MKKRLLFLILPIITLILEILPYGAVCNFMLPSADGTSIGHFRELYSYFDLTPFGYANFAPLLTALMSCIITLLVIVYCFTGKQGLLNASRTFLWVCTVISLGPLVLGIRFYSIVGALITFSLLAELIFLSFSHKAHRTSACE